MQIFHDKFKEKSGNVWGSAFAAIPSKYIYVKGNTDERDRGVKWQYYLHNSVDGKAIGWYDYSPDAILEMEMIWRTFQANDWLTVRFVTSGHFTYAIDLPKMTQKNSSRGTVRAIRRLPTGVKPTPAPPKGFFAA